MIGKWTGSAVEDKFEIGRLTADNERQHEDLVRTMQALIKTEQEVEKLKAEDDMNTSCIIQSNTENADLATERDNLKAEIERLEAKVKRFHERAQETLARIVPLTGEITRLREALEKVREYLRFATPRDRNGPCIQAIGVIDKALKDGE